MNNWRWSSCRSSFYGTTVRLCDTVSSSVRTTLDRDIDIAQSKCTALERGSNILGKAWNMINGIRKWWRFCANGTDVRLLYLLFFLYVGANVKDVKDFKDRWKTLLRINEKGSDQKTDVFYITLLGINISYSRYYN